MAAASVQAVTVPVGAIKSFGAYGPEYEVLGLAAPENGKQRVKIILVRTGEVTDYDFDSMMTDPEAL